MASCIMLFSKTEIFRWYSSRKHGFLLTLFLNKRLHLTYDDLFDIGNSIL